jgi:phosphoribosylglycinamide formyltransferase-1
LSGSLRVVVLVSGSGTNLQAILDRVHGRDGVLVVGVASSKAGVRALERGRLAGVATGVFDASGYADRAARDGELADWIDDLEADLVVLAGFMQLLSPDFLRRFPGRVINVHPSLLPAFPGVHPIEDQLAYGVRVGGATIHFVDEGVDTGPIIMQEAVPLPHTRDPEEVRDLIHEIEHRLLPRAIQLIALGAVRLDRDNPRLVHVEDSRLEAQQ